MTREELLEKICYSDYTNDCCSFDGRYDCQDCKDAINPLLDEYDKQIKAEVIEEFLKKDKECQQSSEDCPYANSEKGCIECIAEQLNSQDSME